MKVGARFTITSLFVANVLLKDSVNKLEKFIFTNGIQNKKLLVK